MLTGSKQPPNEGEFSKTSEMDDKRIGVGAEQVQQHGMGWVLLGGEWNGRDGHWGWPPEQEVQFNPCGEGCTC